MLALYKKELSDILQLTLTKQAIIMEFVRQRLSSLSMAQRPEPEELPVIYPAALTLEANDSGSDYIIGAPHANLALFQQVERLLIPNDRLFVCGNIVNRGPDSWALIQHIEEKKLAGAQIHLIRGNHENRVLRVLQNWEAVTATESSITLVSTLQPAGHIIQKKDMSENTLYLQAIKDNKLNACLLINSTRLIWTMPINNSLHPPKNGKKVTSEQKIKKLVSTYGYAAHTVNTIRNWLQQEHQYPYSNQATQQLYTALFDSRSDKNNLLANFSSYLYSLVLNGGAWIIDLATNEREKVASFIHRLPYLIRIDGQFDCVHAAPPPEEVIQRLLGGDQPSPAEIKYITGSTPIQPNGRTQDSLRAYTAHSPLYGSPSSIQTYHDWNILVVNAGTFLSQALLVVNHTQNLAFSITGEAKPKSEVKSLQEVTNIIQSFLRADLNRLTSTSTALLNWEQTHRDNNQATLTESCLVLERTSLDTSQLLDFLEDESQLLSNRKINWNLFRSTEESDEEENTHHDITSSSSLQPPT